MTRRSKTIFIRSAPRRLSGNRHVRVTALMEILVLGVERVVVVKLESTEPYLSAKYPRSRHCPQDGGSEVEALSGALLELAA